MNFSNLLAMIGGLALFLYGMDLLSKSLERAAGEKLRLVLERLTSHPIQGFLLGAAIAAAIQSSSAATVMVIGFVNSGAMQLSQAVNIIIGSNVGTTLTAWILSISKLEGGGLWLQMLKPAIFAPILTLLGVIMTVFLKRERIQNVGSIVLGFAILMLGMERMSEAMKPLAQSSAFARLFTLFSHPLLGVLTGAVLTAIIQSSTASVGILQALSATGAIPYAGAIPIIMGQNIGTCATVMISGVGASRNARRAAVIHLYFNVIGVVILLLPYTVAEAVFAWPVLFQPADSAGIALIHTGFNLLTTAILLPFSHRLEQLACLSVRA